MSPYLFNSSGLLPLVVGFLEGDGHQKKYANYDGYKREIIECSSTYENIIKQVRQILIDNGIWSSSRIVKARNSRHKTQFNLSISRSYINKIARLSLRFSCVPEVNKVDRSNVIETEEGFWLPVKEIKKGEMSNYVYNFEVEKDHTYVASNIVNHNCMAFMMVLYHEAEIRKQKVIKQENARTIMDDPFWKTDPFKKKERQPATTSWFQQ